jgi:hypothetical protein
MDQLLLGILVGILASVPLSIVLIRTTRSIQR